MTNQKTIQLYLMDGEPTGKIKCQLTNWIGLAYKIPRSMLESAGAIPELKQTGVYMLFGANPESDEPTVYIGQAVARKDGGGVLNRWLEHTNSEEMSWWTEAVVLTTCNNSLGPTEISYLENKLYNSAVNADRFNVRNGNEPNLGNVTEEKESELGQFLYYARMIVGALNYKVFEPITKSRSAGSKILSGLDSGANPQELDGPLVYFKLRGASATGRRTSDGFVVFKGSKLSADMVPSISASARRDREKYSDRISPSNILQKDTLFRSPSGAADFLGGSSFSGIRDWKSEDGTPLFELEGHEIKNATS